MSIARERMMLPLIEVKEIFPEHIEMIPCAERGDGGVYAGLPLMAVEEIFPEHIEMIACPQEAADYLYPRGVAASEFFLGDGEAAEAAA